MRLVLLRRVELPLEWRNDWRGPVDSRMRLCFNLIVLSAGSWYTKDVVSQDEME